MLCLIDAFNIFAIHYMLQISHSAVSNELPHDGNSHRVRIFRLTAK